jgi:hypothetical protein
MPTHGWPIKGAVDQLKLRQGLSNSYKLLHSLVAASFALHIGGLSCRAPGVLRMLLVALPIYTAHLCTEPGKPQILINLPKQLGLNMYDKSQYVLEQNFSTKTIQTLRAPSRYQPFNKCSTLS